MDLSLKGIISAIKPGKFTGGKRFVGIDIGSSSIKVVELKAGEEKPELCTYGELQLGPYADLGVGEAVSLPQTQLIEALVDIYREAKVETKNGVLAMPLASSFVTIVPVTVEVDETIESKIRVEARKYIPLPLSDVTLDWTELASKETKEGTVSEVLLAAIQNEALSGFRDLTNSVAMVSQPSEIEVFSVLRAAAGPTPEPCAVIDLGAQTSKLYISHGGLLQRIHRVYDGGSRCTKQLMESLKVTFEEAENIKRTYDPKGEHAEVVLKAFKSTVDRPLYEFKRVIDTYEKVHERPIARVVLTGGVSSFHDFPAYASEVLGKQAYIENVFSKVSYPMFLDDTLSTIAPSFAVSLGAALRMFEV